MAALKNNGYECLRLRKLHDFEDNLGTLRNETVISFRSNGHALRASRSMGEDGKWNGSRTWKRWLKWPSSQSTTTPSLQARYMIERGWEIESGSIGALTDAYHVLCNKLKRGP
jgi:hypothetical protein